MSSIPHKSADTNDEDLAVLPIIYDLRVIEQSSVDEKHWFCSLNNRLEHFIGYLNDLELGNRNLLKTIDVLITTWGVVEDNDCQLWSKLDSQRQCMHEQSHRQVSEQAETKTFNEQTQLTNRMSTVFFRVFESYKTKRGELSDLICKLDHELHQIQVQLDISDNYVHSCYDDYQKEQIRFRSYLSEWSQITTDKWNLLDEIELLQERYRLRLNHHQDEINEWQCLINNSKQDSGNFYQNSLETIKQLLETDYEQMLKEQHVFVEIELTKKLKRTQEKIQTDSSPNKDDEEHQYSGNQLHKYAEQYERFQCDCRRLTEEVQEKRRILEDLEKQAGAKAQQYDEQRARFQNETDLLRDEYYELKDELDRLVYILRFDVEEELKIYQVLLNALDRDRDTRLSVYQPNRCQLLPCIGETALSRKDQVNQNRKTSQEASFVESKRERSLVIYQDLHEQCSNTNGEEFTERTTHVKRKYKGKIRIKLVDTNGRFIDIENVGNQRCDLTGWYIERTIDGRSVKYTFPPFQLDSQQTVRVHGTNYKSCATYLPNVTDSQLIVTHIHGWGRGHRMCTELFNQNHTSKAIFEQTTIE